MASASLRLIGNAVKCVRHQHEISRPTHVPGELVGVAFHELAICRAGRGEAIPGRLQHVPVDVDCDDGSSDLRHWQRKPAIPAAEIDCGHVASKADRLEHAGRVGP